MRTFPKTTAGQRIAGRVCAAARARLQAAGAGGEDGFLLIEVMVSSLMVALIVVATFNGFDLATKVSADQRRHDEAAILAAQSQEQLRSLPATALVALETSPNKYTRSVGGTTYTIKQTAKAAGSVGKEETVGCTVTSTSSEVHNIQISSSVTWAALEKTERPPVKESGVVTPPTGSAIEVDVINGLNEGVSGITAKAVFTPTGTTVTNTIEGTTDSAGCVVLSGIQATEAEVEILERTGFVTRAGALKVPKKKLTIAPNITTHYIVPYAEAGRIAARFTYKGATEWNGEKVVGDTFIAQHVAEFEGEPKYEPGATFFKYEETGEEKFTPVLGTCDTAALCVPRNATPAVPAYEPTAYTAAGSKYPNGDLFPFKGAWRVWAGDCEANATGDAVTPKAPEGAVTSGQTTTINVPLGYTQLSVYKGSGEAKPEGFETEHLGPVQITNEACESAPLPPNAKAQNFVHEQTETLENGRLEEPFQPFGTFQLCLVDKKAGTAGQTYTISFTNKEASVPSTPKIYLKLRPNAVVSAEKTAKKAEYEAKEAYKEKSGYSNRANEAKTEKIKYEEWLSAYGTDHGKYETEKTAFTTDKGKYETEKTAYGVDKGKYETEKTNFTTLKGKYETEKTNFTTLKGKYETEKATYETKKTAYENKKKEYEKNKKLKEKEEYEKFQTEYKTAENRYKQYEGEYKTAETKYKQYEGEYKTAETKYKQYEAEYKEDKTEYERYEGLYKAAETAYKSYEGKYKTDETEYKKYEAAYKLDEQQATEYQYYLEYKAAKAIYESDKTEEAEAAKAGVTVNAGTTC